MGVILGGYPTVSIGFVQYKSAMQSGFMFGGHLNGTCSSSTYYGLDTPKDDQYIARALS
jgi:hypothetical protein